MFSPTEVNALLTTKRTATWGPVNTWNMLYVLLVSEPVVRMLTSYVPGVTLGITAWISVCSHCVMLVPVTAVVPTKTVFLVVFGLWLLVVIVFFDRLTIGPTCATLGVVAAVLNCQ